MEKEVSFKNKQGETLSGYLHVPSKKYRHGIILAHCFTCSKHIGIIRQMCDYLAKEYLVLRFDFSGNGESGGKFEDATYSKEIDDYTAAIHFLLDQGVNSVGALGHSMGSAVTILSSVKHRSVKAIVTLGGDSSTWGIQRIFSQEQLECMNKKGKCQIEVFGKKFTMKREFLEDAKKHSLSQTLKKSKKPICIIHGEKDEVVNVDNARRLYFYANEPKNMDIIKNGNHMFTSPKSAMPSALKIAQVWFKKYLK